MADVILNPGVGGNVVRTVTKGGLEVQVITLDLGGAGAESLIAGSVPVTGPATDGQLRATPLPVSGTVATGGLTDTQLRAVAVPVSNSSLPLPTGASTSALQTTGNTSVGSIDTKTPALGQALAGASVPVVLTAAQVTTLTPLASVGVNNFPALQPVSDNAGSLTVDAPVATPVFVRLSDGAAAIATLPVSLATLPALTAGAAVIGALTANQSVNVAQINGVTPLMGNGVTGTGSQRVTIASDNTAIPIANPSNLDVALSTRLKPADTLVGVTTVATVTNLAQLAGAAIAMNTGTRSAGTQRVTIATDDVVPVSGTVTVNIAASQSVTTARSTLGARTSVTAAAVDTSLLAANTSRFGATVYNDTDKSLYLALGTAAASTSSFTVIVLAAGYYETPFGYTGAIRGIWAAAPTGSARITEIT